ncbi:hypothetical protein GGP77_001746 [Salinibacter ruber]|uniref:hypothetical protein n=1 Tax=Salinibacter ruber TaxID=146919 RepID=UPI0021671BBF|nr:hypothetical protein [Salinibacter ruber]MCS3667512.1 hypothetical protein [Salinibacter ruber]MCS3695970.1 hypothetical protein [Salinibacter ruber]
MRHLRRKLTLRAHDEQIVLVKRKQERIEHVWMKAFLWALHLPHYPDLDVEVAVDDKYKPDVVAMDRRRGRPQFWGEAGAVGPDKTEHLVTAYPDTHLAFSKWDRSLDAVRDPVDRAAQTADRTAPIDLFRVPADGAERFVDAKGRIAVSRDDLRWVRVGPADG